MQWELAGNITPTIKRSSRSERFQLAFVFRWPPVHRRGGVGKRMSPVELIASYLLIEGAKHFLLSPPILAVLLDGSIL